MVRETSPRPKLRPKGFGVSEQTERMLEPEGDPVSPTEVMKTGLTEEVMGKAQDYVDNPPPEPKKDPLAFAAEKGYVKAIKGPEEKEKYISNLNVGTKEGNQTVRKMFENILGKNPDWDPLLVNWCATFVSDVLDNLGADPLKTNDRYDRLRARKYVKYGSPVERKNIQQGDIVVLDFPRDSEGNITFGPGGKRDGVGDHVTFYVGDKSSANKDGSGYIGVLGGNQGYNSEIGIAEYPEENILAVRRITYDDVDYEFTEALAKDNPNFKAFLKKEGEGFDMKSLEENPMSPSNTPMTSRPQGFDEGGFASKALDFLTSPLTGDYRKEKPTSVQMAELGLEASPVGTVNSIIEDPSWGNVALEVAPDLLGLGPAKKVGQSLIKGFKTGRGSTYKVEEGSRTTRERAPDEVGGKVVTQPTSGKTIYMSYDDMENFGLKFQKGEPGLYQFVPIEGKKGKAHLIFAKDSGANKKGDPVPNTEVSFTTEPKVGDHPVEIYESTNNNRVSIHFGSEITEVMDDAPEMISVFPKPERMFPEDARPKGGDYLNPATGEVISGRNVSAATLKISPDGKPSFKVSNDDVETVGSTGKGKTQIKTNLFKKKAGWKWKDAPEGMEDIATLISVENKGKHYYTIETDFSKGVNLKKYPNSKTEPRLRPTVVGEIELGPQVGTISVRGKEHPVYSRVRTFNQGGAVMNEQMEMAFMAEGGLRDDGLSVDPVSGNDIPNGSMAEEVRDDIPAQLSEGEYVVPADVVRFYGVKFFEDLREEAKRGLADMESNGRIGGEPVPAGGPQVNEAPVTEQEMAALREIAMEMNVGGMVPPVNPNMQPPPQAVGNAALQQPQMMNKGGTVLGFQSAGDTGTTSDALSAVQSKPLTGGGLGFSLFGPYTNDGSLPTGFGDDTKTTPFEEGQIVELYKDGKVLSFVMMRDYQDYLDKIAEGWLTKEQKDAKIAEEGPTVAGTDDTTTDDEGTGTTDSSNDKTDYRQFTTQTSATPPKNVADMTDDELKVALEGMNIVGRTGSTLAYTMGLPVGALVGSQLASRYNNMLEVARDRKLISDKEYESKRKGSIFGGEKSLFDNLIDRSDQNEKLGTTNKKGTDFGDTWLGDLLGFDGKAGVQGPGLKESFGGARRDQTAITPSSTYAAPTTGATAPGDMGDGLRGSGSTSSAPKTQAEKTAAAKSATDDWVSATQAVQSTSTDDPKAWSDAIKAQSEASKAATKAIQEASGWSGGFFGSASNPDWRDAAAEGGLMSKKNKKKKK
jgi:hypothetical protein